MNLRISVVPRNFRTAFVARTSRGAITDKVSYYIFLETQGSIGIGEGAPLNGLSLDGEADWNRFRAWLETAQEIEAPEGGQAYSWAKRLAALAGCARASSIVFALESAALSLLSGQPEIYFPSSFTQGSSSITINGLVWMDTLAAMRLQAEEKVKAGFTTIKFKIGSLDWQAEHSLLVDFRRAHSADEITLRVDANGAYAPDQAMRVMDDLHKLAIHSIEQPIRAGQHNQMHRLVNEGAIPIALDEELITPMPADELFDMIRFLNAPYLVLKPTLIGGLAHTEALIAATEKSGKAWWLTSSLETPIGLTVLAQFAARYPNALPHGLSTGKIYADSFAHPNVLEGNWLHFDPAARFDIAGLTRPNPPQERKGA